MHACVNFQAIMVWFLLFHLYYLEIDNVVEQ